MLVRVDNPKEDPIKLSIEICFVLISTFAKREIRGTRRLSIVTN